LPLQNISSYPTKHIAIECNTRIEHIGTGSEYTDLPLQELVNCSDIGCFANIRCLFVVNFAMNTNESFLSTRQKNVGANIYSPLQENTIGILSNFFLSFQFIYRIYRNFEQNV